jgi:hypothetical protein
VAEDASPAPEWETLGVSAALLTRYQRDQDALLEQLAAFLEGTLPRQTVVTRTRGVLGPRRTTRLTVELGGFRYAVERGPRGALDANRVRVVRGVTIKTEPLAIEDWLREVTAALAAELERTTGGRDALNRLLQT